MLGVSHGTIKRALAGADLSLETLQKFDAITPRIRTAEHVRAIESTAVRPPKERNTAHSWSIETIRSARDGLLRGEFKQAARMAIEMRTHSAIAHARHLRLLPLSAVSTVLEPHASSRGRQLARRAEELCIVPRGVLAGINATCVDFGFAVGYNDIDTNKEGTGKIFRHREWPIEHVRWDEQTQQLIARTDTLTGDLDVPIVHGDGRWTVYRTFDTRPWQQDAAIVPACLIWAKGAMGDADWASLLRAHGMAKLLGTMPEGEPILCDDGATLTPRAQAYLQMLTDFASGDAAAGINPPGGKTEILSNASTAFQIFDEFLNRADRAAARVYCGTDAILGTIGGAPGIDIAELFGVMTTILQTDATRIEDGLFVGVHQPWTIANTGSSALSPRLRYQLPDPDADRRKAERASCYDRLTTAIKTLKDAGLEVTQEVINRLAAEYDVPAPTLAASGDTSSISLAPTDNAKVILVIEARAAQGLPPFGDARDHMTITELDEALKAKAAAATAPTSTPV